ncbi:hypothetical protein OEZ86_003312 [Tetradesmus obliquus]|nr:hypothetical protein OEZ86_003312 [Tetradesmus obliquus]
MLHRARCLAANPLPFTAHVMPRQISRRTVAARAFLGQQLPDAATCTFTKAAELTGAVAPADPTVWPIVIAESELAQSELYTGSFKDVAKSVTINLPPNDDGPAAPVLVFFGGFQARASWYQAVMARLASAGYATVQYDTQPYGPFVQTMGFEQEIAALPQLLQWLAAQNKDASNPLLHNKLDMSRVAVAGHSRGGKLAALQYAQDPAAVKAAYLLDPVDELSSSAVQQLAGRGLALGVTAAGITGAFNPERSDYRHFLAAAACGSQLHIIPDAHHLQFCSSSPYLNALLDTADNLFTDAGMSHMGASLLLALYLYLAGCKASGRPLPASAMLGCNSSDERVALFDELYHHMLDDLTTHHGTSLQQLLLPGLPDADGSQLAAEWDHVLLCMREHDEGELLEHAILGQLASIDRLSSGGHHHGGSGSMNSDGSGSSMAGSYTSLNSLSTLSSADAALTVDGAAAAAAAAAAGMAGAAADAGRERVAALTAEAMLLWLDAALKKKKRHGRAVDGAAAAVAAVAAGMAGAAADAGRERVAALTAEAMLLWLDAALKQ